MAVCEPGGRLPDADVADVDAATYPLCFLEPLRHLDEPARLQAGGVLEKDGGTAGPLAQARIELAHHGKQAVCLRSHLTLVVDDQAGNAASESAGEFYDQVAALLVQEIGAAVQVDHRQAGMGRHEPQNMIKFTWRVGVHLGGHAHLGETEPGEPQERIVACDTSLEQGMNGPRHLVAGAGFRRTASRQTLPTRSVTIHDLHSTPS
jgi:hypothetical protein